METDRRKWLIQTCGFSLGVLGLPTFLAGCKNAAQQTGLRSDGRDPEEVAANESLWRPLQKAWTRAPGFTNIESGFYTASPDAVMNKLQADLVAINARSSHFMRRDWLPRVAQLKETVAKFAGCAAGEIALMRNTTEALTNIILGLQLQAGDEVLMGNMEYPSMVGAFNNRQKREGIRIVTVDLPLLPKSDDEVLRIYRDAITPKTKVILASHMIYLTGQILPIRAICDMAHERGVEVIVDAAHSFAHLNYRIPDLHCDYFGTSLHKWLGAPMGNGLMYIAKDKIHKVRPLFDNTELTAEDIGKFEHLGTQPAANQLGIADAIEFHQSIGSAYKEARLRYLKEYWVTRVRDLPGVSMATPMGKQQSCAIAVVKLGNQDPVETSRLLYEDYGIFTVAVEPGVRIAPNLWSSQAQMDQLVAAIQDLGHRAQG